MSVLSETSGQSMLTDDDLVNDMASGCKPRGDWCIGIEHEQFVFDADNGNPLPYDGAPGIRQILEAFTAYGWEGHEKDEHLIEAQRGGAFITLEPGGQIELAGSPCRTLDEVKTEAGRYYRELNEIGKRLGFGVLAQGVHPRWTREDIHWMPKERYRIMGPYMEQRSRHGVDMMILTTGAQVNLDFSSEVDMVKKYRVALGLQPFITALMANSRIIQGKDSGYDSFRSFIWTETDPDRCGVPEFVFSGDMGFARYVDYALDVPMYAYQRGDRLIGATGGSFRDFMTGGLKGHEGEFATLSDWRYHLTTIFLEVRLKTYLEFRGPDSAPPPLVYAMAAFWAGILYDDEALSLASDYIKGWPAEEHTRIRAETAKYGLGTRLPDGRSWRDAGRDLLDLAEAGLGRREPQVRGDLAPFKAKLSGRP